MRKNFDNLEFAEFTLDVLQEFINSQDVEVAFIQGFTYWYDVEGLRDTILSKSNNLNVDIVVRRDCSQFHHIVHGFDDVTELYDCLYEENLQWYFDNTTPEEVHEIMSNPYHTIYEGFEDFLESEYFKPPNLGDLDFWFDDYVYYICLHLVKF